MIPGFLFRTFRSVPPRLLWSLFWYGGVKGALSVEKFKHRAKRGVYFPPFLHFSITNACNLRCQGCWVDVNAPEERLDFETLDEAIREAKRHGNSIFGLLGGEPFMHPELFRLIQAHPDAYFQVFTNGQFITDKVAGELRRLGNVTPLVSIEGLEKTSDERRGKREVLSKTLRGLKACVQAGLFTGVATSLCQTNIDELLTEDWLRRLIAEGAHYVWYYAYRPAGSHPNHELALRPEQLARVRRFIVEMRCRAPLLILETYYDHQGFSLCPMATGLSHHISPRGEVEPCPVIQFACENIRDPGGIFARITASGFLQDFRTAAQQATRGCVVLERPDLVAELARRRRARDSTSRGTALSELESAPRHFSQWLPGQETPEKHWAYWLAKRLWFNDFGAYDQARHDTRAKAAELKIKLDPLSLSANTGPASS